MRHADVIIAGAGIVGASIAWHLAHAGCRNVILLERESHQGRGSTGKSMGGVRAQFATDLNIRMSLYSIPFYARFEELTGHPAGYRANGYLFCATSGQHANYLRANRARQEALGLKGVEWLTTEEITRRVPILRADDILGGSFCPTDGFVDPYSAMTGFTLAAESLGVELLREAEVIGVRVEGGAIAGVETTQGPIAAPVLVNACGAWAAALARLAGAELPVVPLRRMLTPSEPFDGIDERWPMTIDMSNGFHFRPEGRGVLLAWNDPEETPGFKNSVDPAFVEKILTRAANRVPAFAELPVNPKRTWAGLYEVSPDHHAILGPAPEVQGLYYANGFSGHGVMHAPATGKVLADLITKGDTGVVDWRGFSVTRFAEGREIHETAVL